LQVRTIDGGRGRGRGRGRLEAVGAAASSSSEWMTNKNKINWSVRPNKRGIPKGKTDIKRGPNKKGDARRLANIN